MYTFTCSLPSHKEDSDHKSFWTKIPILESYTYIALGVGILAIVNVDTDQENTFFIFKILHDISQWLLVWVIQPYFNEMLLLILYHLFLVLWFRLWRRRINKINAARKQRNEKTKENNTDLKNQVYYPDRSNNTLLLKVICKILDLELVKIERKPDDYSLNDSYLPEFFFKFCCWCTNHNWDSLQAEGQNFAKLLMKTESEKKDKKED